MGKDLEHLRTLGSLSWRVMAFFLILFHGACSPSANTDQIKAEKIWQQHERVFIDLQEGRDIRAADFDEACKFFYSLTKIEIPSDHNPFLDCFPTKDSYKALAPLRQWYSRNHDRLYWDNSANEVRLRPE